MEAVDMHNGHQMPIIGLGTWKSKAGDVSEAVKVAIDVGYTHIDCAYGYGNEKAVGAGIRAKIDEGAITRDRLFVVSKLWNTRHAAQDVRPSLQESLDSLGLDYLDLYLVHWPVALKPGKDDFPKDENGKLIYANISLIETWQAMEKCVDEGLIRSIGVSNFNSQQIQHILDHCRIKPANLQIEIHPYLSQRKLLEFCQSRGVTVTAYSPFGSPDKPEGCQASPEEPPLLENPTLESLATKYSRSTAQIVLRWLTQRSIAVIPKSVTPARIRQNYCIFDFKLSEEDMDTIFALNKDMRLVVPTITTAEGKRVWRDEKAPNFPFLTEF